MQNRTEFEEKEKLFMAPYAVFSGASRGREYKEPECPFRTAFQRDISRIVHSTAFRRLDYKTQVFIKHEGDYYRTRLTHTLEVGQIATGIARILRLNEDLAQAIAYAHDLGHSPFGHPGEEAMNELMASEGGFEHNLQSFRVVTFLEEHYPDFRGLNLSYEVLEGIVTHTTDYDRPRKNISFKLIGHPSLEAQIVNCADEIAFMNHDLDDALEHGLLTLDSLKDVELWNEALTNVQGRMPKASKKVKTSRIASWLITSMIDDVQKEALKNIKERGLKTVDDVRARGKSTISFSEGMKKRTEGVKTYLLKNVYCHSDVVKMRNKAQRVIKNLFNYYMERPKELPPSFKVRASGRDTKRHVCDYIVGMTDRFSLEEHRRLFKKN